MRINAKFDEPIIVDSEKLDWQASPMPGVSRRPLDRVGAEVARATSIVRYDAGSQFSPHVHTGGEEFLVLEGVFQDEHGDFPAGSYIRNPPQSSHTPGSEQGCVIFVKLWQFEPENRTHVRLNINFMQAVEQAGNSGVSIVPLYTDQYEEVSLFYLERDAQLTLSAERGLECLLLTGEVRANNPNGPDWKLNKNSWLRLPIKSIFKIQSGPEGAKLWVKRNHLNRVDYQIQRINKYA